MKLKRVKISSAVSEFVSGQKLRSVVLIPAGRRIVGSVYKYSKLISQFSDVFILYGVGFRRFEQEMDNIKPDFLFCWGDGQTNYAFAQRLKIPYVLVEMDVFSLRKGDAWFERDMVKGASHVLCTSELHAQYLKKKYHTKSLVIPLKPFAADLDFSPLPKLEGQNLVYAGSIVGSNEKEGPYGYRWYVDYFKKFMSQGWDIHIYPGYELSQNRIAEYENAKMEVHPHIAQHELYRELSQYQAGFHGYNKEGVPEISFNYSQLCQPNKTWEYLAAGIPTLSYNGGFSADIIRDGGWGTVLKSLDRKINLKEFHITDEMRYENVIDPYVEDLKQYLGISHENIS